MKNLLIKLYEKYFGCWHTWGPTTQKNGQLSRQYEVCTKCEKKQYKFCDHEWSGKFTHYGINLQLKEDGQVWMSTSPKDLQECGKCGVYKIVYNYQR